MNNQIKCILILLFCCFNYTNIWSQQWERIYGGADRDEGVAVIQAMDGNYVIAGTTRSFGAGAQDFYLVKIDAHGDTLWTKTYGTVDDEAAIDLEQTYDGGFIISGSYNAPSYLSCFLVRTDSQGDSLWTHSYPTALGLTAFDVDQTIDSGFIFINNIVNDTRLIKTDALGDTLWTHAYSSIFSAKTVEPTQDGGYIIAGTTPTTDSICLLKTDSLGDIEWTRKYYWGPFFNLDIPQIKQTSNGDYVLIGSYYPGDDPGLNYKSFVQRVDLAGNLIHHHVPNISSLSDVYVKHFDITANGDYVFASTVLSPIVVFGVGVVGYESRMFMSKFDSTGTMLFNQEYGGADEEYGGDVIITNTGGFVLVGSTSSYGLNRDVYAISTDSAGQFISGQINGQVFQDNDLTCNFSSGDINLEGMVVRAALNGPSSFTYYGTTDSLGRYNIPVQPGTYTLSIPQLIPYYSLSCPQNTGTITAVAYDSIDFPLEVSTSCPLMAVDVATPFLRPGFSSTYTIQYCNRGTTMAQNVSIEVDFDTFLNISNFSVPPSNQVGNMYTFNVGNVAIGACDYIYVSVVLPSTITLGQTHCVEAHILPDSLCLPPWTGMVLDADANCQNDTVFFSIQNVSTGLGVPTPYWVFEDDIIMRTGSINVSGGNDTVIIIPASPRKFYRIEVAQEAGIPWTIRDSIASAFVEGCLPDINGEFNISLPTSFSNGHSSPFMAIDCRQNSSSFDPNNKIAQPVGYQAEHYIQANQYIDYQINFQNTGTDTAFTVVLIDTLSEHLNPSSIQPTAASHSYTWQLKDNGVLEVHYANIMLPDSNVNEPASHGFIKFRIQQNDNNPTGTIIENFADIYFDFNAPVRTNSTFHEIGEDYFLVHVIPIQNEKKPEVQVYPNPFSQQTTLEVEGAIFNDLTLALYDLTGRLVEHVFEYNNNKIQLERKHLLPGIYIYNLKGDGKDISTGKVIVR